MRIDSYDWNLLNSIGKEMFNKINMFFIFLTRCSWRSGHTWIDRHQGLLTNSEMVSSYIRWWFSHPRVFCRAEGPIQHPLAACQVIPDRGPQVHCHQRTGWCRVWVPCHCRQQGRRRKAVTICLPDLQATWSSRNARGIQPLRQVRWPEMDSSHRTRRNQNNWLLHWEVWSRQGQLGEDQPLVHQGG